MRTYLSLNTAQSGHRVAMLSLCLLLMATEGRAVGQHYQKPAPVAPATNVSSAWKTEPNWQVASPQDAIPKGAWWHVFHDSELDRYEEQLLSANQSLVAARASLEQARSMARVATSGLFPHLSADPGIAREGEGSERPLDGYPSGSAYTQNVFSIPFTVNYEADIFGRQRRNVEAANATLQSDAADLQNALLVLTAELAADYFTLRELDSEYQVVEELVGYERKGLELVSNRHEEKISSELEVAQQSALLNSTLTQLALVQQSRAQYEHAIAALTGQAASNFTIPRAPLTTTPPAIPLGVPSEVLERRPDIASFERQVAYANAQVGLAKAAFYPVVNLGVLGGWQSRDFLAMLSGPSLLWSIGADVLQPIFDGGKNRANLAAARNAYNATVGNYRQSVLTAFRQVEDGISNLQTLAQAGTTQTAAVADAEKQLAVANNRYIGGLDTYLDVIVAQTTLLDDKRLAVQLQGQQMVSSVYLVKALGGGWNASDLNKEIVKPKAIQIVQP